MACGAVTEGRQKVWPTLVSLTFVVSPPRQQQVITVPSQENLLLKQELADMRVRRNAEERLFFRALENFQIERDEVGRELEALRYQTPSGLQPTEAQINELTGEIEARDELISLLREENQSLIRDYGKCTEANESLSNFLNDLNAQNGAQHDEITELKGVQAVLCQEKDSIEHELAEERYLRQQKEDEINELLSNNLAEVKLLQDRIEEMATELEACNQQLIGFPEPIATEIEELKQNYKLQLTKFAKRLIGEAVSKEKFKILKANGADAVEDDRELRLRIIDRLLGSAEFTYDEKTALEMERSGEESRRNARNRLRDDKRAKQGKPPIRSYVAKDQK